MEHRSQNRIFDYDIFDRFKYVKMFLSEILSYPPTRYYDLIVT